MSNPVYYFTMYTEQASSDNGCFSFLSSETQRILDRMDDSETYMNMKPIKTGSRAPSRDHLTSTNTELNIRKVERLTNTQADGLDPTYCQLNLRHNGLLIAKDEDPPIASGPGEVPVIAQAAAHEQESKVKIGNRPYRLICLLRLVTSALIVIVFGLSIHVSQIRHQFTEMETKYRFVNETKAQICELLTSRREQTCSQDWIRNEDLCYFISSFESSYERAKQLCSIADSKLLEINSNEEENFVNNRVLGQDSSYWIGTCKAGKVASNVVYKVNARKFECSECKSSWLVSCKNDQHRFICEKPAPLCPDIPEKIRDLCQKPVEPA
ncbi:uncharacterized protein [Hemitrygon akajei]|uniref:uncharacterized protein n=1 Tax=Hemitrygon akajei TaxID=2704970 RepID=UPI003BF9F496